MTSLYNWTEAACAELGVQADDDAIQAVLDLAGDVAHQIERPAGPVSAFLLGLAVGGGQPLAETAERLRALAEGWPGSEPGDAGQ